MGTGSSPISSSSIEEVDETRNTDHSPTVKARETAAKAADEAFKAIVEPKDVEDAAWAPAKARATEEAEKIAA